MYCPRKHDYAESDDMKGRNRNGMRLEA